MNSCRTVNTGKYFKACLSVCWEGREEGRQAGRQGETQADRLTDTAVVQKGKRQTERDRPADWLPTDRYTYKQADRPAGRPTERQTDRQTDIQTEDRQTDRKIDFETFTSTVLCIVFLYSKYSKCVVLNELYYMLGRDLRGTLGPKSSYFCS
jgi:hypothetical protein